VADDFLDSLKRAMMESIDDPERVLRSTGGFILPRTFAQALDIPLEALYHCDLCARYPVRLWFGPQDVFYVLWDEEPSRFWRLVDRLFGFPTGFHRVEFFPKVSPLRCLIPRFAFNG
jgi:hypothetical protein